MARTGAKAAHDSGFMGGDIVVGVVDSGVTHDHPALQGRVTDLTYVPSPPNDLTVDDVVGHGTAVAQIIAGKSFGQWPGGIAPDAEIVSARIIWDEAPEDDGSGEGNPVDTAEQPMALGLGSVHDDLIAHGAKIMNNSWGGLYWKNPESTALIAQEYSRFVNENGGLVVFATGNEGRDDPHDMAALPSQPGTNGDKTAAYLEKGWLAVTALDVIDRGRLASYANACGVAMRYCLAAPGSVAVTGTNDAAAGPTYWSWTGTSLAAPQVSGAAALVWEAFPWFDNEQVRQTILGTAVDLGIAGVDPVFGNGALNVGAAVHGPGRLDWGQFIADFDDGTVVFSNVMTGEGGITKRGTGRLELTGQNLYQGITRIEGGTLTALWDLPGDVFIGESGNLEMAPNFYGSAGGSIENQGTLSMLGMPGQHPLLRGDYHQTASGRISFDVGAFLNIDGKARIDGGEAYVHGVIAGYAMQAREKIIMASEGVTGKFDRLTWSPAVFLQGSLSYEPNTVWLNIDRLDVASVAMSLASATPSELHSAVRVEAAFEGIDHQRDQRDPAISTAFIDMSGRFQTAASVSQAVASLKSLSGEMHAAADAAGLDNLEASRRALSSRFGDLAGQSRLQGNWYRALGQPGQGGLAFGQFQSDGWLMGSDHRLGTNAVAGFAFGSTDADGFTGSGYDRSHERQTQARFYAGAMRGNGYALGQFGAGRYERQLRRKLLLGDGVEGVATDYSGRFTTANLEAGYRFGDGGKSLVPYAGIDYVRLDRDGFIENGASGFGLKTNGGSAERTLALAGVRAERAWTTASGLGLALRGYAEWQRSVSERGLLAEASFVGAESWSPLYGEGFARSSGLFGLGLDANLSRRATLSLGYDQRFGSPIADRQWAAKLRYGF